MYHTFLFLLPVVALHVVCGLAVLFGSAFICAVMFPGLHCFRSCPLSVFSPSRCFVPQWYTTSGLVLVFRRAHE